MFVSCSSVTPFKSGSHTVLPPISTIIDSALVHRFATQFNFQRLSINLYTFFAIWTFRLLNLPPNWAGTASSPQTAVSVSHRSSWAPCRLERPGPPSWGRMNKEQVFALLDAYVAAGGNFVDTANAYQNEQSEAWIGEWMSARKNCD